MNSSNGRYGTIAFQTKQYMAVMERQESGFAMPRRRYSFMVENISSVSKDQALIYSCWLRKINHHISLVQGRVDKKMASLSNGSGTDMVEFGRSGSIGDIVDSYCKKVLK